ncbi:LacI family DNA-binding transcriptional regulator [Micrococcales bacterium 31B]|nr:LacI family DNA-binding transcriptional regulator [Micrococcales bacterium 31B]
MHDVAAAAGVSVSTVSKVINERYGVAAKTAVRVQAAIAELGYESSLIASSLRRGRTNVIGVLVAGFEPFAHAVLEGISEALTDTGYELLAYSGSQASIDPEQSRRGWEQRSLSKLGGTLIDGAIVVTPSAESTQTSIPIVAIDPHTGTHGTPSIDTDNYGGGHSATRHLLDLGHTRIAHARGRTDLESARERERGYRAALTEAGVDIDESLIVDGEFRAEPTAEAVAALLDRDEPPTAIFAANDISALAAIGAARAGGLDVPGDLSVVGFDDIPAAVSGEPRLTTIRQPLRDMGRAAAETLLRLLAEPEATAPERLHMPIELIVRGSTAAPRK